MNPELLGKITELFRSKAWPMTSDWDGEDAILFDNFCRLLDELSAEEQQLVMTITEDFVRYTSGDYPHLMSIALRQIDDARIAVADQVIFVPLITSEDVARYVKSGPATLYLVFDSVVKRNPKTRPKFLERRLHQFASLEALAASKAEQTHSLIIFVDDFVGTGEYATAVLAEFEGRYRKADEDVAVLSLVALRRGVDAIADLGYDCFVSLLLDRGISDSTRIQDFSRALAVVDGIENRLSITASHVHGYLKSEALVKMIRTPDNTFPLYWCPTMMSGNDWPAPFPRER